MNSKRIKFKMNIDKEGKPQKHNFAVNNNNFSRICRTFVWFFTKTIPDLLQGTPNIFFKS